jgi:tetratricopeptide (TPR) repeat protein
LQGEEASVHYTQVCRTCHMAVHEQTRRDCTSCHMQKSRTQDAVHVVITDHQIRKGRQAGDLLSPIRESHDRLSGPVKLLYPARLLDTPENRLYLAMADGNPNAIGDAIRAAKPPTAEPYLALAEALRKSGRGSASLPVLQRALELSPEEPRLYVLAAEVLIDSNESHQAMALLAPALKKHPDDPSLLNTLAALQVGAGQFDNALRLVSRAVDVAGNDPLSWLNLGVVKEAKGDRAGAIAAYQQALVLQPDFERARSYLDRLSK